MDIFLPCTSMWSLTEARCALQSSLFPGATQAWGWWPAHLWGKYSWALNDREEESANPPCSRNPHITYSQALKYEVPLYTQVHILRFNQPRIVQSCSFWYWKKSTCRWNHQVQIHIIQGSTVYSLFFTSRNWCSSGLWKTTRQNNWDNVSSGLRVHVICHNPTTKQPWTQIRSISLTGNR